MRTLVVALLFPAVASAVPPGLKKSGPLKCGGSDEELVVSKRYIEAKGDGVAVQGRCKVTITDSYIVSTKAYAVSVVGEAEVTIHNTFLKGGKSALYAVDAAKVISKGNTFSGGLLVMGQADYDDQGGNKLERSPEQASIFAGGVDGESTEDGDSSEIGETAQTAESGENAESGAEAEPPSITVLPKKLRKSRPVVCRKRVKAITLKKRVIDAKGDGVIIYGNCTVTVLQSLIKAGGWAISHQGKGKLIIKDSILEGGKGAVQVRFTPAVELAGSTFKGKLDKPAEVEIADQGGNTFE